MSSPTPVRRFGRRYSVAVLAVIAAAVATLGLLVGQTSRHSIDGARMNVAGHQRLLSERLVAQTLLARAASPSERELWRPRIDATVNELRIASQQLRGVTNDDVVIRQDPRRGVRGASLRRDSVRRRPEPALPTPARQFDFVLQQRRLAVSIEHVVDELERNGQTVDHLLGSKPPASASC